MCLLCIVACCLCECMELSVVHGCECAGYICLFTQQWRTKKEDKLIRLQKKTGPDNLPLKAVIALMAAAAALLSKLTKGLRTGSISLTYSKGLGGGRSILAIVSSDGKLSQAFVRLWFYYTE